MSKKIKPIIVKNHFELAEVLGLIRADAIMFEFRSELNTKIIEIAKKKKLSNKKISKLTGYSKKKINTLLNRSRQGISVDFMLNVLFSLDHTVKLKIQKVNQAVTENETKKGSRKIKTISSKKFLKKQLKNKKFKKEYDNLEKEYSEERTKIKNN